MNEHSDELMLELTAEELELIAGGECMDERSAYWFAKVSGLPSNR